MGGRIALAEPDADLLATLKTSSKAIATEVS